MVSSGTEEQGWFSAAASAVKKATQDPTSVFPEATGNVPDEPRQWCNFEYADFMEQGLGTGLSTRFIEACPPSDDVKEQRLLVHRSQNRLSYTLAKENGKPLLIAKAKNEGTRFDIYIARDGVTPLNLGPSFVLQSNTALNQWKLHSVRCELCESRGKRTCGKRELARMSHYIETVGEGQAFCLDLELPQEGKDGDPAVLCDVCGDPKAKLATKLTTRRPKWNPKHKSLTLDFRGRCSMASAKNFQLESSGAPPTASPPARFLFGKTGMHSFVLDFRHPLGNVQAFAAALTASHWK